VHAAHAAGVRGGPEGYVRLRTFSTTTAWAVAGPIRPLFSQSQHPPWLSGRTATPGELAGYARFRPVVDSFDAPIDMAVAYGSGVIMQANKKGVSNSGLGLG
jgi:hypothetical protein